MGSNNQNLEINEHIQKTYKDFSSSINRIDLKLQAEMKKFLELIDKEQIFNISKNI